MKKKVIVVITLFGAMGLFGCGKANQKVETLENESTQQTIQNSSETEVVTSPEPKTEESLQTETNDSENTTDKIFDAFLEGSVGAHDSMDSNSIFYVTDLDMDSEEWDSYSIGEKTDLDNDGEKELIINGPYGGIYLDARNNEVYEFAAGEGTALSLSYVKYNGEVWILYSNNMNEGYRCYHMEKYEGADHLIDELSFGEELIDANHPDAGLKYSLNDTEITAEEYRELCSKIFGTEEKEN